MPVSILAMSIQKPMNFKQLRVVVAAELNFINNLFSVVQLPQTKDDDLVDDFLSDNVQNNEEKELPKRARSIAELEEKLQNLKSQNKFNLKNKLAKKSINSKLSKKIKKKERQKNRVKGSQAPSENTEFKAETEKNIPEKKRKLENNQNAKPVFNTKGKLVFSKFDFSNVGRPDKLQKKEKDPRKILENLKKQEEKFKEMEEKDDGVKVKELKEKMAWKNILQKAEGQKIKDDPLLLKKSMKKMEQKKKHSQKKWGRRIEGEQKQKEEKQKRRSENISKKKKEKKVKKIKTSQKRGRIVL